MRLALNAESERVIGRHVILTVALARRPELRLSRPVTALLGLRHKLSNRFLIVGENDRFVRLNSGRGQ